jgi:hypothetical protein
MMRLRQRLITAFACACVAGLAAVAAAGPLAGGPEALRPVAGSGEFRFSGSTQSGTITGTATTKAVPSAIKPGEPVRFVVSVTWTETTQIAPCPFGSASGSVPNQTEKLPTFPLISIRAGRGEDVVTGRVIDAPADSTARRNGVTWQCGPPNRATRTESFDARVPGSGTADYAPGCYAPAPSAGSAIVGPLGQTGTFEGTFATLSVGGAVCTGAAAAPRQTFTDTFTTSGQVRSHAVAVAPNRTRADVTLRWARPGDRFTVAGVVLAPTRKTQAAGRAQKLKITFFSRTATSIGVRITNLQQGKLTFRVVGKKVSGRATVRTRVVLKA